MTIPKKPSPPVTNKADAHDAGTSWYRVPVVWIGIFLTLIILAGLVHLIIVSHDYQGQTAPAKPETRELRHVLGVPLSREPQSAPTQGNTEPALQP